MIRYQRIVVSTQATVGPLGALPRELYGLTDGSLANLPAALDPYVITLLGFADTGFLPVTTPDVPQSVNRLQFVTALQNAGSYATVAAAINALPATDLIRLYFANTAMFIRSDDRLLALATAVGQNAAQVDALFTAADQIAP